MHPLSITYTTNHAQVLVVHAVRVVLIENTLHILGAARIVAGVTSGTLRPAWPSSHPVAGLLDLGHCCTAYHVRDRPPSFKDIEAALLHIDEGIRQEAIMQQALQSAPADPVVVTHP